MKIAVPKETVPGERRVALTPEAVAGLVKSKLEVIVETGAGDGAFHSDEAFTQAGARIVPNAAALYNQADIVTKVQKPTLEEVEQLREGTVLVSFLQALTATDLIQRLATRRITSFGMEGIPRISRAQKMDALSSQANIAGYKAVLIAAESLARFFPMLMTAAGTVFAARVLVIGAGVAGHQPDEDNGRTAQVLHVGGIRLAQVGRVSRQPELKRRAGLGLGEGGLPGQIQHRL